MFHKILVALDDSATSQRVFQQALDLAKATGSQLLLLHVLNPVDQDYPNNTVYPSLNTYYPSLQEEIITCWQKKLSEYEEHHLEILRSLTAKAKAVGVSTEFTQNVGDPGRTICTVAYTWGADLILLGRRGRSGVSELILGSVSNYVMHHAPCSVLTVQGLIPTDEPQLVNQETLT